MEFHKLTKDQISVLEANGNVCEDGSWADFEVSGDFDPGYVKNSRFSGKMRVGRFDTSFTLPGGMKKHSGIYNACLHNVTVGDGCLLENVQNCIANYDIGAGTHIENVGIIAVDSKTSFGNGTRVSVLNETGGREVIIHDRLSSHQAYMSALYRHCPEFIEKLDGIVTGYVSSVTSDRGSIGKGCTIMNMSTAMNVKFGDCCKVMSASRMSNGSINSNENAPVYIGHNVVCEDFIVSSGSHLDDGTMLTRCFVGQNCVFGHNYSASDCLFFCNCQGENGEACAIFAGPFTVTHHKSTLLIAGMFSFMNAGSGSNQSNHMYKLGPIHQGILERGAKTSSDSYILWPSRVGAFSLVMGRHVNHSDTSNLPFSYLIEKGNTTYLAPGVNLRSVGTIRDVQKWPKRDARCAEGRLDYVNFNLLSPYTIQKMFKGLDTLRNLLHSSGELSDVYSFHSAKITNSSLRKGIEFYSVAIDKFLGNSLISRLRSGEFDSVEQMRSLLRPDSGTGRGAWVDVSGLIAPESEIQALMDDVTSGKINTLSQMDAEFSRMHSNYYSYEWTWAYDHFEQVYGMSPADMTLDDVAMIVRRWRDAVIGLDKMVYEDARKEFNLASMTGFGADGDSHRKMQDFEYVRGDFESNSFVSKVLEHMEEKNLLADKMLSALEKLR